MYVDVHCHLDDEKFKNDLDEVIRRAENKDFISIISNGVNHKSNKKTLEISNKYKIVKAALGLYPLEVNTLSEEEIQNVINFIIQNKNKIIALGEVGLDFSGNKEIKKQVTTFEKFISISEKSSLPLIVHSRKAEKEVIEILESSRIKRVILHCFSGNKKLISKAEDLNFLFSIPPIIKYSKHFQFLVEKISLKNILTETDSPYLSDVKGVRNEPINVEKSVKIISKIKKLDFDETKKIIFMNYKNFFIE